MTRPKFTIITICFNNLEDLQKTCLSIEAQTVVPFEHWVINGSTQADIAQWAAQSPQPAYRKFLHEKDKGISDAMNKGIARAEGEILHLLHAGDLYAHAQVLEKVGAAFLANPATQWLSGKMQLHRGGLPVVVGKPFDPQKIYRGMRSVFHPTWFVRPSVYVQTGTFHLQWKIAMDYDLLCRMPAEGYLFLPEPLVVFDDQGISTQHYLAAVAENIAVYESYHGFSFKARLWAFRLRCLHWLLLTPLGKWLFAWKKKMGWENV